MQENIFSSFMYYALLIKRCIKVDKDLNYKDIRREIFENESYHIIRIPSKIECQLKWNIKNVYDNYKDYKGIPKYFQVAIRRYYLDMSLEIEIKINF